MFNQPLVSVIIACKNNSEYITQCLDSLQNQTYKNWELIVVDNFSTDKTFEIAQKYTDKAYQLGPERSTQFNFGFSKSSGDLIYRIGAEFRLEPDVIQKCVDKIVAGFDAVAIHNRSVGESIWAKVRYLERESYKGDDSVVAVRFFKREVFAKVGGFDENLVANEDFDLHNRIVEAGYKWTHADAVEDHLGEPKNLGDVWNKFYYYGKTMGNYMSKYQNHRKHVRIFRSSFSVFYKELFRNPKLFVAFLIYMSTKTLAGASGYIVSK
jgi:glycosyltransferase involved in cell wall biosynthesis